MATENTEYKILIADDEPENIEAIFNVLHHQKYQVIVANNGKMCCEIAFSENPSLIILDWDMPVLDGISAIKILKSHTQTQNIPIIMATGKMITSSNLQTALEAGANDYIRKPFDNIEIIARVNSMIRLFEKHKQNIELEKELYEQKINAINEEFERNKKSLTSTTLKLIQNSELNTTQFEDLLNLKKISSPEGIKIINSIIARYKINSIKNNWKEFEILFEQVHKSFYERLLNKFPDISQNERKICAFLKLNMSNKDISAITFQNENCLKKARSRLRQKFGIETDVNIVNFIQNI